MVPYLLFFGLLGLLYLFSQAITRQISYILSKVLKSQTVAMYIIAILFFPGVLIHEFAHFITAIFLGVHAGNIEFFPKLSEGRLKLGSVQIQSTDPFRKTLIGVAPVIWGNIVLLLSVFLFRIYGNESFFAFLLLGIFYFQVSNTMFSSKKDMEGTGVFFIVVIFVCIALFLFKIPILSYLTDTESGIFVQSLFTRASFYLGVAAGIDVCLLLVLVGLGKIR